MVSGCAALFHGRVAKGPSVLRYGRFHQGQVQGANEGGIACINDWSTPWTVLGNSENIDNVEPLLFLQAVLIEAIPLPRTLRGE